MHMEPSQARQAWCTHKKEFDGLIEFTRGSSASLSDWCTRLLLTMSRCDVGWLSGVFLMKIDGDPSVVTVDLQDSEVSLYLAQDLQTMVIQSPSSWCFGLECL